MRYRSILAAAMLAALSLVSPVFADGTYDATVRVSDQKINTVRPEIFGDNLEWIDSCKLYRPDLHGFDPEMVQDIKDAGVRQIRYPGGTLSEYFDWRQAIGTNRTQQPNPFNKGIAQYPYFGPEELKQLTDTLGIPAYITLNAGTGTPDEAAAWVKYCRDHGQKVSAFEVGNEVYMDNIAVNGVKANMTAPQYIAFFLALRKKVDSVVPGTKLGTVGLVDTGNFPLVRDPNWLSEIVTEIGGKMDFVAIHDGYALGLRTQDMTSGQRLTDDDYAKAFLAAPLYVQDNIEETKAVIAKSAPAANIDIHITEHGALVLPTPGSDPATQLPDLKWNRSLTAALYMAGFYNVILNEPRVTDVDHMPLIQEVFGALVGVANPGPQRTIWKNAEFYVFQEYSGFTGRDVLRTDVASPVYAAQSTVVIPADDAVPCLDADAFRTPDGSDVTITLLNRDTTRTCHATIRPGPDAFRVNSISVLTAPALDSTNDPGQPEAVHPISRTIGLDVTGGKLDLDVPPHALMTLDIGLSAK